MQQWFWVLSGSSYVHIKTGNHLHSHQRYFQLKPFQLSNAWITLPFFFFSKHKRRNICMKELWWEIRCFAAIIPNRIISTSGWRQYCSNMTSSHPSCDGVTTEILSVNMNQRDPHKSLLKRPWQHGHHLFMHTNGNQTCSQRQFHLCCFCHLCLNNLTRLGDTMCRGGGSEWAGDNSPQTDSKLFQNNCKRANLQSGFISAITA